MSKSKRYPGYLECVGQILQDAGEPLAVNQMLERIEALRPVGRSGRSAVYGALSMLFQAVPVEGNRYGWLSHLLAQTSYRHVLGNEEVRRGYLLLDELEHTVFHPQFFQQHERDFRLLTIDLFAGPTLEGKLQIQRGTWSLTLGRAFVQWLDDCGGDARDHLIIQVIDAELGHYSMRLQPYEIRNPRAISARNRDLAALAENLVEHDRRKRNAMPTWDLATLLIGRDFFQSPIPPDDLHTVLHKYSILNFVDDNGYGVRMPDDDMEDPVESDSVDPHMDHDPHATESAEMDEMMDLVDDDMLWGLFGEDAPEWQGGTEGDMCVTYDMYLSNLDSAERSEPPLAHEDFHLLEAELEMLVALELEFGMLLPEQKARKENLGGRLFIDPDSMLDNGSDNADLPGFEDPPYWDN